MTGNQLDLNHLWAQVQELSNILQANRDTTAGLVRRADELRGRVNAGDTNGTVLLSDDADGQVVNGNQNHQNTVELESEIRQLREENSLLKSDNEDLSSLVTDYVAVLEKVLEGLRAYAHEHTMSTINIHQNYTAQLAHERAINAQLRQNEASAQARLATITKLLRQAYELESSDMVEADRIIAELQYENEVLRQALGVQRLPAEEPSLGGGVAITGGTAAGREQQGPQVS